MNSRVTINFEELFNNLLITLRENGINVNKISYNLIDRYGVLILHNLNNKGIDVKFNLDNSYIDSFFDKYKELYKESDTDASILVLKKISLDELILQYQACLPSIVLESMYDKDVYNEIADIYFIECNEIQKTNSDGFKTKMKC